MKKKEFALDSEELLAEIGEDYKEQLEEEIELLDGASAEFDMDLVSKRTAVTGIFRFCFDKLWCGDVPAAFSSDDYISAAESLR